jgi:hypothetical protein
MVAVHICRIFDHWVVVYFGQFWGKDRNSANFGATFFHGSSHVLILTINGLGYILATLSQTHLATLPTIAEQAKWSAFKKKRSQSRAARWLF